MTVPENIRDEIKQRLWQEADQIDWIRLSATDKSKRYENWTRDDMIGGRLSRFMDKGDVRVYIKDSLLKEYSQKKLSDFSIPFRALGIATTIEFAGSYKKPHGRRLTDGRVICWGRAEDWKGVLMAVFERAYSKKGVTPFAAVLTHADGRFHEENVRQMIEKASTKLGISKLVWVDF